MIKQSKFIIMRALTTFITLVLILGGLTTAQGYRNLYDNQFKKGEKLIYRVHYGFVDAGEVVLEIKKEEKKLQNRDVFHMVGLGYSTGMFNWFFKVRDRYETYMDSEAIVPLKFVRRVNEGGYKISRDVEFNQLGNTAKDEKGKYNVPKNIQDLLSAFYYTRCLDFSNAKVGDVFPVQTFLDHEVYEMNVKYLGKEKVKNNSGTYNCIILRPMLQEGRVFKEEEDMTIWVSDDKNHIPIRAQANIFVGSIKMDLKKAFGVDNFTARIK